MKSKILKWIAKLLGKSIKHKVYRWLSRVPSESLDAAISVEVASSRQDLEKAYRLLHDCYVAMRLIDVQPSKLRCNLFTFLPTTTTVVVKKSGEIVGTVSLIRDSKFGLPSDKEFLEINNRMRAQGKSLIEVSALAVAPQFRSSQHGVSLCLMKYLYNYCRNNFSCDILVAVVHPRAEDFYQALFQFETNSPVVEYKELYSAAAIHLTMDLSDAHKNHLTELYKNFAPNKNLWQFILMSDIRFKYPRKIQGRTMDPVMNPDLLNYFCLGKEGIWSRFAEHEKQTILQIYSTLFGAQSINALNSVIHGDLPQKEYRTPLRIGSAVTYRNQVAICEITDLSAGGCFLKWTAEVPKENDIIEVSFTLNQKKYRLQAQIAWQNQNGSFHKPTGFGLRFLTPAVHIKQELLRWLYESEGTFCSSESIKRSA